MSLASIVAFVVLGLLIGWLVMVLAATSRTLIEQSGEAGDRHSAQAS